MSYRLGIDIGGTFTDATLINETTGEIHIGKVPSTPKEPSRGFLAATQRLLRDNNISPASVSYLVHGTTIATNAIIERKLAKTGFVTTEGFRDMLEIARQIRPSLYDLQFEKPQPLVPRYLCFGVPERLDAKGKILTPLNETAVAKVAEQLLKEKVESVAICLMHAHANSNHEQRVAKIIEDIIPGIIISLSAEVAPEFREYLRASTTVINASIRPIVSHYLKQIEQRLRADGMIAELLLMQSSGGVFTFNEARKKPVFMVESGPAAGVISASYLGNHLGHKNIISFDMGGTTAKVGLIRNGSPQITKDYEVGAAAKAGVGSQRGSGYPIRTPVIDLVEIGAGGGSIAWVDSGGILRVGPQSAGADPGPACYNQGGNDPTLTDANLVLGRLSPNYFLGGEMKLDIKAAKKVIKEKCADPLGMDLVEAAHGIIEIANAAMVNAFRLISVQRGYDPREFVLIAFGGAGPVHANRLAQEIKIPLTMIPMSPGTTSSLGLLVTDLKHDYSTTMIIRTEKLDASAVEQNYQALENKARTTLEKEGVSTEAMNFLWQVEIRYVGQSFELTIPLSSNNFNTNELKRILNEFHQEHDRAYGFSAPAEPVEFVNLKLTAVGQIAKPKFRKLKLVKGNLDSALIENRPVYFAECQGYVDCPVYDRYRLSAEQTFEGPAIVVEMDSTTVIHPSHQIKVDEYGTLLLSPKDSAKSSTVD